MPMGRKDAPEGAPITTVLAESIEIEGLSSCIFVGLIRIPLGLMSSIAILVGRIHPREELRLHQPAMVGKKTLRSGDRGAD